MKTASIGQSVLIEKGKLYIGKTFIKLPFVARKGYPQQKRRRQFHQGLYMKSDYMMDVPSKSICEIISDGIVSVSSRKQWCYSREGMIYSLTNTNSLTSYSSGIVIYSIRTTIGIQKSSFTLPYFIRDHLGSVRTIVDGLMLKTPSPISGRDKSTTRMEMRNTCIIQKRIHSLTRHAVLMTCSRIRMLGKQLTKV